MLSEVMEADVFFDSRLFQQLLVNPTNLRDQEASGSNPDTPTKFG